MILPSTNLIDLLTLSRMLLLHQHPVILKLRQIICFISQIDTSIHTSYDVLILHRPSIVLMQPSDLLLFDCIKCHFSSILLVDFAPLLRYFLLLESFARLHIYDIRYCSNLQAVNRWMFELSLFLNNFVQIISSAAHLLFRLNNKVRILYIFNPPKSYRLSPLNLIIYGFSMSFMSSCFFCLSIINIYYVGN